MLKIKQTRSYIKNGKPVFVYEVSGSKDAIAKYKELQGENYRETKDGVPLWFTIRSVGATGELVITTNGKIVPDMSAFHNAESLAKQFGGSLGNELAKVAAAQLLGTTNNSTPQAEPVVTKDDLPS